MKKKYKLKKWVIASIYTLAFSAIVVSVVMVNRILKEGIYANETLSYVYRGLFEDIVPVVNYENDKIIKPFASSNVSVLRGFYDKDAEANSQEKSLIMYQNTYMPNTGILYKSDKEFDILAVMDGTVSNIEADEMMGNIVTIKHSNNLETIYECLNEVNILVGDIVKQGDIIGTSGSNKIESESENMLLFEVINNGEYLNPDKFYEMKLEELS